MSSNSKESVDQQHDSRRAEVVNLPTSLEAVEQGRSLVVVIGINEYVHQHKLKNAVQDATGLQQTLIDKLGFSAPIPPLVNEAATKSAIWTLVEDRLYEVVEENDSLIIFFAGHGTTRVRKIGGKEIETGYLIPVDATQSWSEYVDIDPFLKSIGALPARHILVILDSCESGLALGQAMQSYRDTTRYAKDLSSRFSRKVITSAQRDQLAKDGGGPIPGHSLFTGTLIDGFNWGKADLDGNGLISSSELGLFIQQQVAQASESKQTPDFGSFHLDDRGEMVISLRDQSFDALKARAFSSLQNGELSFFEDLVKQLVNLNPRRPETLYLEYRLNFFKRNFDRAIEIVDQLIAQNPDRGVIPLSMEDLRDLRAQFDCWQSVLKIPDTDFPLEVEFLIGPNKDELQESKQEQFGNLNGFLIEHGKVFQLKIGNPTNRPMHVYMIEIDESGRFETVILWPEEEIMLNGLLPGETGKTYPYLQVGSSGISELRLFSSPKRLRFFLFPASASTRGVSIEHIESDDLNQMKVKSIYYSMTSQSHSELRI